MNHLMSVRRRARWLCTFLVRDEVSWSNVVCDLAVETFNIWIFVRPQMAPAHASELACSIPLLEDVHPLEDNVTANHGFLLVQKER